MKTQHVVKNRFRILVIEDEMIIAAHIAQVLEGIGYEVCGILPKGEHAIANIQEENPDLVLLDIMLRGKWNGIETARQIKACADIPIIFLTSNGDRATFSEAKKVRPAAFLTKPFHAAELERAIELAVLAIPTPEEKPQLPKAGEEIQILDDWIFIKEKDLLVRVPVKEIIYIQAESNYCRIATARKSYLLSQTLKMVAQSLSGKPFLRVHRSWLINLHHLENVGPLFLQVAGKEIPISKSYRADLLEKIQSF